MVNQKYGTTSWDEETGKRGGGDKKRDSFMRLAEGSNVLRVVTKPHLYLSHKYKEADDQGYGEKILCSMPLHKQCPVCDLKDRPKKRWYVGVIDRKTNQYKILDISVTVYDFLKALNRDEDYGDPIKYDIDIKVNKEAGAAGYYNVIPKPPKPMSDSDLAIKANASEEDLDKRCAPPEPEWVLSKLNTVREKMGKSPVSMADKKVSNGTTATPVDMSDDSDVDFPVQDAN